MLRLYFLFRALEHMIKWLIILIIILFAMYLYFKSKFKKRK
jgi:hypothetical protein